MKVRRDGLGCEEGFWIGGFGRGRGKRGDVRIVAMIGAVVLDEIMAGEEQRLEFLFSVGLV